MGEQMIRILSNFLQEDEEPLPDDELPEYKKPPNPGNSMPPLDKVNKLNFARI